MSQIIGGHTFVPLERNIDDVKLNSITSGATITTELISTQTQATTSATGDQYLILKSGAGNLNRIAHDDLVTSIGASPSFQTSYGNFRLRSYSAIGNPNFSVDQRLVGTAGTLAAGTTSSAIDRWFANKTAATAAATIQQMAGPVSVPGTNFAISSNFLRVTLTTQQVSLAAGDFLYVGQSVEGPALRELISDVHSCSLLVRTSVAGGTTFGLTLLDGAATPTQSLSKLCTIPSANTWTLITLPNLPVWPGGGTFPITPGAVGYLFRIVLAAGSTWIPAANDSWQGANKMGAVGQASFLASPVSSTFDIAFCQHESGSASQLIDKPFTQNYDECLRYYQKSYHYTGAIGNTSGLGLIMLYNVAATGADAFGLIHQKPMAKAPTVAIYDHNNGALNSIMDSNSVHHTVTAVSTPSEKAPFYQLTTTGLTVGGTCWCQYTADTGM